MKYQLEIKQLVDYPRCRIYRSFIRNLMELCRQVNGSARFQNYRKRFVSASITR